MSRGILELTVDCATDRTANKKGKRDHGSGRAESKKSKIKSTPVDARGNRMISERTGIAMKEKRVDGEKKITAEEKERNHRIPSYIYKSNLQS